MNKIITFTDRLLKSKVFLFLLSFGFSILLFFNVNQNVNFIVLENTVDYVLNDVKLEVVSDSDNQIVEGAPSTISFKVNGKKADVERFKSEAQITAKIDAKEKLGENIVLPVQYTTEKNYNVVLVPQLKELSVNVYKKVTLEKEFQIVTPDLEAGLQLKGVPIVLDENNQNVKQIKTTLDEKTAQKIEKIEVRFTPQKTEGLYKEEIEPIYLDSSGNTISIEQGRVYQIQYEIEKVS